MQREAVSLCTLILQSCVLPKVEQTLCPSPDQIYNLNLATHSLETVFGLAGAVVYIIDWHIAQEHKNVQNTNTYLSPGRIHTRKHVRLSCPTFCNEKRNKRLLPIHNSKWQQFFLLDRSTTSIMWRSHVISLHSFSTKTRPTTNRSKQKIAAEMSESTK